LGPFRGPAPRGVFQTIEVGSGRGEFVESRAEKHPHRRYAAVEPNYAPGSLSEVMNIRREKLRQQPNISLYSQRIEHALDEMRKEGIRARHMNIDMPIPIEARTEYLKMWKKIFELAPHILLPNGSIFVSSESTETLKTISEMARKAGFRVRALKPIQESAKTRRTYFMEYFHDSEYKIHRLQITFGLKKAIPKKWGRRNWPRA